MCLKTNIFKALWDAEETSNGKDKGRLLEEIVFGISLEWKEGFLKGNFW